MRRSGDSGAGALAAFFLVVVFRVDLLALVVSCSAAACAIGYVSGVDETWDVHLIRASGGYIAAFIDVAGCG